MRNRENAYIPCVITDHVAKVRCESQIDDKATGDSVEAINCVQKLLALGLSAEEIKSLDVEESVLEAVCGGPEVEGEDVEPEWDTDFAVELISRHLQDLDLELEMLAMRRKALRRRTRVLEKLVQILRDHKTS